MKTITRVRDSQSGLEILIERGEEFIKFSVKDAAGNINFKFEGKATGGSTGDYFGVNREMSTDYIEIAVSNENYPDGFEVAKVGDKYDASVFDTKDDTEKITCQCPRCKK